MVRSGEKMDKQSADNGCQVYHLFSILPDRYFLKLFEYVLV
jgi:hypothetical protein